MTDLVSRIHTRLAREGCCKGYQHPGIDAMRSALVAILGCHPPLDANRLACLGCGEAYPCREVRFIAAALKVEIDV